MKKLLLIGLAMAVGFGVVAQNMNFAKDMKPVKAITADKVSVEPTNTATAPVNRHNPNNTSNGDATSPVTVLQLGTSANAYGYGYAGGQKTLVWADDNLNAVLNIHRMGPGSNPPGLSGYLGIDLGVNMGATQADWTNQIQIYNSVMPGGDYYIDAARYPQAAIYNPEGNTALENAYCVFFAPNLSNSVSGGTWGGYSYGVANLADNSDSTKHLYYYNPPPYTYIPDGFSVSPKGVALMCDLDQDWGSGSMVWQSNIIIWRGEWTADGDFDYTPTLIECETKDDNRPANDRLAFSPDGNTAWVAVLGQNDNPNALFDSTYYPILWKSIDGGVTWGDPITVTLDGPNGIEGIKQFIPDNVLAAAYGGTAPPRDEVPYTTAFDFDIAVDAWGNPHLSAIVGLCPSGYSIATADSMFGAFDIYSGDGGNSWCAQFMGFPLSFRGDFGDLTEDNRIQITTTKDGLHMFVSWIDTQVPGVDDNLQPDIFCRGFNLSTGKITGAWDAGTSSYLDQPNNVTFLSDVMNQAWFYGASHYAFTDDGKFTIPFTVENLSNPSDPAAQVDFKYIPDFYYMDEDFAFDASYADCLNVGISELSANKLIVSQNNPNPFRTTTTVTVELPKSSNLTLDVYNITGQKVQTINKGFCKAGSHQISVNGNNMPSGIYFYTVTAGNESVTNKMIVE